MTPLPHRHQPRPGTGQIQQGAVPGQGARLGWQIQHVDIFRRQHGTLHQQGAAQRQLVE
ncbi:hypothetical protein [Aeromonas media]|uniref:hypothetical protein n=1 Tax=Aeromonas media TaxID=651 RepID=UPI00384AEFB6